MSWLPETLLATSLLMLAVLVLRAPVRRLWGASAAYGLWLLPAARFLLPSLDVAGPLPAEPMIAGAEVVLAQAMPPAATAWDWLLSLWALGALAFAVYQIFHYRRYRQRVLEGAELVAEEGGLALMRSAAVEGPVAIGFVRRLIVVPADFSTRYSSEERELVVAHEAAHHRRGDLWANAVALGLLALSWPSPLAHWCYRRFRHDQELACDERVIGDAQADRRHAYARTLVKTAAPTAPALSPALSHAHNLKRRLAMLNRHTIHRSPAGALAVAALTLAGLGLTATGGIAAEPVQKIEKIIIKREAGRDMDAALEEELSKRCGGKAQTFGADMIAEKDGKPAKMRFLLCAKDGASGEDRLAMLEKARARISASGDLGAPERAQILATLDQAIADLKQAR